MQSPRAFRDQLTTRILGLVGAAALVAPLASCGGSGVHAATGAGGAGAGAGSGGSAGGHASSGPGGGAQTSTTGVHAGSTATAGGAPAGTTATAGGAGGTAADGGSSTTGGPSDWTLCGAVPASDPCPTDKTAELALLNPPGCPSGWRAATIDSAPTRNASGECCYQVKIVLCVGAGRPYVGVDGDARLAAPRADPTAAQWSAGPAPRVGRLTRATRRRLAAAWTSDGLLEHASVASFSRFSLALLAAGAPAALVALAHEAALDEVEHARLCFALAGAYAGAPVAPGPFPFDGAVSVPASLGELVASTVREGCVGETVAAALAAEQLARATDPAVRAALARLAADEARHAELAWRTVAWALGAGGGEVRDTAAHAFAEALAAAPASPSPMGDPAQDPALEAHGRLGAAATSQAVARALAEIVAPCAAALLAAARAPGAGRGPHCELVEAARPAARGSA